MRINVAQLLKEGTGATRHYDIDETIVSDENQEYPIHGEVDLTRVAKGILVHGTFACQTRLMCSRCLNFFTLSYDLEIEEMFYPSIDILTGFPVPLPYDEDESGSFTIDEHHILDMTEMIRQYSYLAIPMKPLCQIDCAGLCPECGTNLNEKKCHCTRYNQTALSRAFEEAKSRRKLR